MNQKPIHIIILFVCMLILPVSSYAWWEAGHMLVANIAYKNLSYQTKKEVNRLLKYMLIENTKVDDYRFNEMHPNFTAMALSLWPDNIKAQPNNNRLYNAWHYIEDAYSDDGSTVPNVNYHGSIVWAIKHLENQLEQTEANPYDKARSLAFLMHFVGDIHQPLHCTELHSKDFPKGDLGGNLYPIIYMERDGTVLTNLHSLFDSGLNLFTRMGYTHDVKDYESIAQISRQIMIDYPITDLFENTNELNPDVWHQESHTLGKLAHQTPINQEPNSTYIDAQSEQIERQIALAGYRLANVLNLIYEKQLKIK